MYYPSDIIEIPDQFLIRHITATGEFRILANNATARYSEEFFLGPGTSWAPKSFKNTPRSGYILQRKGGEDWEVVIPGTGGAVVPITKKNAEHLLEQEKILSSEGVKTLLVSPCVWVHVLERGRNLLVTKDSPLYQKALETSIIRMERLHLRRVSPGDIVRLHDGSRALYLGLFRQLDYEERERRFKKRKRYYYLRLFEEESEKPLLRATSKIDIGVIEKKAEEPLTHKQRFDLVYDHLGEHKRDRYLPDQLYDHTVCISPQDFKRSEVEIYVEPVGGWGTHSPSGKEYKYPYLYISHYIDSKGFVWASPGAAGNKNVYAVPVYKKRLTKDGAVVRGLNYSPRFIDPSQFTWEQVNIRFGEYEAPYRCAFL